MCLIVSGGHTQLILMKDFGKYKTVGETLDDAAGEAFDKIARILGLGYPGGPAISAEAEKLPTTNYRLQTSLPRPMFNSNNFDFSFAGLKTAVLYTVRDLMPGKKRLAPQVKRAIAAEAQQAIVDVLVSKTVRAAREYRVKSIMLAGGVSANKLLRLELGKKAGEIRIKYRQPEMEFTTDNAVMIAMAGYFKYREKRKTDFRDWKSVEVDANLTL